MYVLPICDYVLCIDITLIYKSNTANDQKSLFKSVDDLLHQTDELKLPTYSSDLNMTNTINKFFTDKIAKIRNDLSLSLNSSYVGCEEKDFPMYLLNNTVKSLSLQLKMN